MKKIIVGIGIMALISVVALSVIGANDFTRSDFVQMIDNTDQCLTNCYTVYKVCNPTGDDYLVSDSSKFRVDFSGNTDKLAEYHFELLQTETYDDKKWISNNICSPYSETFYGEGDNKSVTVVAHNNCTDQGYFETTQKQRDVFKKFNPVSTTFKAGQCYTIKVSGKKLPKLGENNIDNILTYAGYRFTEYAWWNSDFTYRVNITNLKQQKDEWLSVNLTGVSEGNISSLRLVCNNVLMNNVTIAGNTTNSTYIHFFNNQNVSQCEAYFGNPGASRIYDTVTIYAERFDSWVVNQDLNSTVSGGKTWESTGVANNVNIVRTSTTQFNSTPQGLYWNFSGGGAAYNYHKLNLSTYGSTQNITVLWDYRPEEASGACSLTFGSENREASRLLGGCWGSHATVCNGADKYCIFTPSTPICNVPLTISNWARSKIVYDNINHKYGCAILTGTSSSISYGATPASAADLGFLSFEEYSGPETDYFDNILVYNGSVEIYTEYSVPFANITEVASDNEDSGRAAILAGIYNSSAVAGIIKTDIELYGRNINNDQVVGSFDKLLMYDNQRWAFNYLTEADNAVNMFNLTPVLYVLELSNKNEEEIRGEVESFINNTMI